ncbi:MAG TPA: hypothetical protein VIW24_15790 [Aldersonia sp.]
MANPYAYSEQRPFLIHPIGLANPQGPQQHLTHGPEDAGAPPWVIDPRLG